MRLINEKIKYLLLRHHVNPLGSTIHRKWFTLTMLLIFLTIFQWNFIYKFRKVTALRSLSTRTVVTPYLKIQPGLSKLINTSEPNYPYNRSYIHETKTLCTSTTNLTLLVLILSSTTNFHRRRALRQTWTNETFYRLYGVIKTVFLLGTVQDIAVQSKIDAEFKQYGDIVQGGFIDNYHNLTYKSTMGFRWATERCRNAKYVLKTDDDIFINLFMLFQNNTFSESENKFHVYCHQQDHKIFREPKSKWFVEENQFKGISMYPTYCGGSFVLMSNKVVPYFYESLKRTPFFWVEDVLLYGIGLSNLHGLIHKQVTSKNTNLNDPYVTIMCIRQRMKQCPIFVTMTWNILQIHQIWAYTIQSYMS